MGKAAYHHGDLRNALVAAALELIAEHGVQGLSVAAAARKAGVSGAAPYRHFAGRTELLSAVATELAKELIDEIESTPATIPLDADDQSAAIETLVQRTRMRIAFSLRRGMGLELIYAEELRRCDDAERRDVTRRLSDLYLWPAMTIAGDAVTAGRLLRQSAAIAQGYLAFAHSQIVFAPGEDEKLADETAATVRTLAVASRSDGLPGSSNG